jgi:hypothetical protein
VHKDIVGYFNDSEFLSMIAENSAAAKAKAELADAVASSSSREAPVEEQAHQPPAGQAPLVVLVEAPEPVDVNVPTVEPVDEATVEPIPVEPDVVVAITAGEPVPAPEPAKSLESPVEPPCKQEQEQEQEQEQQQDVQSLTVAEVDAQAEVEPEVEAETVVLVEEKSKNAAATTTAPSATVPPAVVYSPEPVVSVPFHGSETKMASRVAAAVAEIELKRNASRAATSIRAGATPPGGHGNNRSFSNPTSPKSADASVGGETTTPVVVAVEAAVHAEETAAADSDATTPVEVAVEAAEAVDGEKLSFQNVADEEEEGSAESAVLPATNKDEKEEEEFPAMELEEEEAERIAVVAVEEIEPPLENALDSNREEADSDVELVESVAAPTFDGKVDDETSPVEPKKEEEEVKRDVGEEEQEVEDINESTTTSPLQHADRGEEVKDDAQMHRSSQSLFMSSSSLSVSQSPFGGILGAKEVNGLNIDKDGIGASASYSDISDAKESSFIVPDVLSTVTIAAPVENSDSPAVTAPAATAVAARESPIVSVSGICIVSDDGAVDDNGDVEEASPAENGASVPTVVAAIAIAETKEVEEEVVPVAVEGSSSAKNEPRSTVEDTEGPAEEKAVVTTADDAVDVVDVVVADVSEPEEAAVEQGEAVETERSAARAIAMEAVDGPPAEAEAEAEAAAVEAKAEVDPIEQVLLSSR